MYLLLVKYICNFFCNICFSLERKCCKIGLDIYGIFWLPITLSGGSLTVCSCPSVVATSIFFLQYYNFKKQNIFKKFKERTNIKILSFLFFFTKCRSYFFSHLSNPNASKDLYCTSSNPISANSRK